MWPRSYRTASSASKGKSKMTVYAKLNAARAAFHAKPLKKSGKNSFAGYSYFELGDFLIPALQVFETYGLCPVVSFDETMAQLELVDVETGERITFTSPMAEANLKGTHPIQNLGAVETYQAQEQTQEFKTI